jgi:hypothetical protein
MPTASRRGRADRPTSPGTTPRAATDGAREGDGHGDAGAAARPPGHGDSPGNYEP